MSGRVVLGGGLLLLAASGILASVALGDRASIALPIAYGGAGAYVAFRRPSNPIGWLLILTGWGLTMGTFRVEAEAATLLAGDLAPVLAFTAWANAAGFGLAFVGLVSLTATFPDGHLPKGRWRLPNLGVIGGTILIAAIIAAYPTIVPTPDGSAVSIEMPNPYALADDAPLWTWIPHPNFLYPLTMITIGIAGAGLIHRSRLATGPARLQYRWFIASVALVLVMSSTWAVAVFLFAFDALGPTWVAAIVSFTAVPIAIAMAVLRYRLFEIDRIISRTLGWAIVSGVLVGVFAGLVVGLQALLADVTQGQTLAVAASTLVAFALFQPVRRRVQGAVDRRFDRARYDGERTATAFAERLRDETDVGTLTGELRDTTRIALAPATLGIWLREVTR